MLKLEEYNLHLFGTVWCVTGTFQSRASPAGYSSWLLSRCSMPVSTVSEDICATPALRNSTLLCYAQFSPVTVSERAPADDCAASSWGSRPLSPHWYHDPPYRGSAWYGGIGFANMKPPCRGSRLLPQTYRLRWRKAIDGLPCCGERSGTYPGHS